MSSTVKTKFAGMLRGLLRHLDENEAPATPPARVLSNSALPAGATPAAVSAPHAAPRHTPITGAAPPPPAPRDNPDELQLPLQPILASLAMDLRAKVMQAPPPDAMICLSVEKVLAQLAFGAVKISFGELRQAAPGVFVNSGGEHDQKPVTLPLNEILPRLRPERFARRSMQKHIEIDEEIAGPFGPGGQGAQISEGTKPTPSTELAQRAPGQPLRIVAPPPPAPAPPTPAVPPPPAFMPRPVAPFAGGVTPSPSPRSHDTTRLADVAALRGNGAPTPVIPPSPPPPPVRAMPAPPIPVRATPAPVTPVPLPPVRTTPAPAAPAPAPAAPILAEPATISVPLTALSEHWPEGLRLEIIQSNLGHAQVLLPISLIEPAMKRGRVAFIWRNLRSLIRPSPPASVHDSTELDLPLNVIAPLFFSRQKTAPRPQPTAQPPADIPNLFFGFPQPESSPPPPAPAKMPERPPTRPAPEPPIFRPAPEPPISRPAPEPPVFRPTPEPPIFRPAPEPPISRPAPEPPVFRPTSEPQSVWPPSPPPPRPTVKPVDAKITDSNYYIWGDDGEAPRADKAEYKHPPTPATDFASRYATPKEIIERAMDLPGVVGAVVALPDGLRVASQVPSDFNADTLAAFLPQIFERVSQCTRELRMGSLNNFNFTVGNVPWRIFRVNAVYFAAFGSAGKSLPGAQLAALAAELDRRKQ